MCVLHNISVAQLYLCSVITVVSWKLPDLLFMDLVAGQEFQIPHVCPGKFPALLCQILKGVLTLRGYKTTQDNGWKGGKHFGGKNQGQ